MKDRYDERPATASTKAKPKHNAPADSPTSTPITIPDTTPVAKKSPRRAIVGDNCVVRLEASFENGSKCTVIGKEQVYKLFRAISDAIDEEKDTRRYWADPAASDDELVVSTDEELLENIEYLGLKLKATKTEERVTEAAKRVGLVAKRYYVDDNDEPVLDENDRWIEAKPGDTPDFYRIISRFASGAHGPISAE